jgi:hypothetical protein
MAHFAKLDENNIVLEVIVIGNDVPTSNGPLGENDMHPDGEQYCKDIFKVNNKFKQTSYNKKFRKKFAGVGNTYNEVLNMFIGQQPFPSFTLNNNGDWVGPVANPTVLIEETGEPECPQYPYSPRWNEQNQYWYSTNYSGNTVIWNPNTLSWS